MCLVSTFQGAMGVSASVLKHPLLPTLRLASSEVKIKHLLTILLRELSRAKRRNETILLFPIHVPFVYYQCSLSNHANANAPVLTTLAKKIAFGP
jgi:hypothetical protein